MLKFFILSSILLTTSAFATPVEQMMSIKERLRISLWVEGIHAPAVAKSAQPQRVVLPEEIERALKKL